MHVHICDHILKFCQHDINHAREFYPIRKFGADRHKGETSSIFWSCIQCCWSQRDHKWSNKHFARHFLIWNAWTYFNETCFSYSLQGSHDTDAMTFSGSLVSSSKSQRTFTKHAFFWRSLLIEYLPLKTIWCTFN